MPRTNAPEGNVQGADGWIAAADRGVWSAAPEARRVEEPSRGKEHKLGNPGLRHGQRMGANEPEPRCLGAWESCKQAERRSGTWAPMCSEALGTWELAILASSGAWDGLIPEHKAAPNRCLWVLADQAPVRCAVGGVPGQAARAKPSPLGSTWAR